MFYIPVISVWNVYTYTSYINYNYIGTKCVDLDFNQLRFRLNNITCILWVHDAVGIQDGAFRIIIIAMTRRR